ncbi:alpha/beta hydrolase [Hoeflea sp. AS60]|uniref:alpha/beta hydrolase n=1 Tax=Hoeflea sp. AS60 TaxID=3135780 RepID=UPI003182995D
MTLYFLGFLIAAGFAAFTLGPRPSADTTVDFDEATLLDDLDAYLAASEARYDDLRPGNERQIIWADPASRARTPIAIIYIHGFSASPGELRPLPDLVAKSLGANLYYARLKGHGRSGDAMIEASVHGWVNDFAEAVAIGRKLGERVIVMATSTGASLTTWAATQPALMRDVAGLVQFSPNYGIQARGSSLLTIPWARQMVRLVVGERRSFETTNDLHARYWTSEYPSAALLPMAALVDLANAADAGTITLPSLFVYSPLDQVIRPELVKAKAENWGGPTRTIKVTDDSTATHHVVAGDALSPQTTERLAAQTGEWIANL